MAVKRANGQKIGSVPYCCDLAPDGATRVPNEVEQAVIQEFATMWGRGMTPDRIAAALTARGVRTKTGRFRR